MKTCRDCTTGKPAVAFYAHRANPDGLDSYCRLCRLERQRQSRVKRFVTAKPYGPNRRTIARDILCRPIPQ